MSVPNERGFPFGVVPRAAERRDDREPPARREADRDDRHAPARDDEHDGGYGDGSLL